MRKRVLFLVLVIAVSVVASYGGVNAKPQAPAVRVGVLVSASGPMYFAGAFQRAGCEMAKEESNILCFYADAGDSDLEAKLAYKQLQSNNVDLIITPLDSESTKRIAKVNQLNPVPLIAVSSVAEAIPAESKDKNWLFRLASTTSQDTAALAECIFDQKPESVAILVGSDNYAKQNAKFLQFSLVLRGLSNVRSYGLTEMKSLRNTSPDAVVLFSMESSVDWLNYVSDWFGRVPDKYLVPGNLANYSMYSWASKLEGTKVLVPTDQFSPKFREEVADYLKRPNLLGSPNSPMFGLAWRTFQAATLAGTVSGDKRVALERMKNLFNPAGYFLAQKYSIYGYGTNGLFSSISSYQPDTP